MVGNNEGWQYQGRQQHGWFGHGTGPGTPAAGLDEGPFDPHQIEERAGAVAHAAVAALPRSLRSEAGVLHVFGSAARLQALLVRWSRARRLGRLAFANHFFGRDADDRTVQALAAAASAVATAKTHGDLRQGAEQVATAMQNVGVGNWPRYLAEAQARADDPQTLAAVAASRIRPVPTPSPAANPLRPAAAVTPVADSNSPAVAVEPEHGRIWWWLHGMGLAKTRHEQAVELRRVMGSQGGLVYMRDGAPLDVDHMSDDEVLALNRETRGQPHAAPLLGAAAPIMTQWGWSDSPAYNEALKQLRQPARMQRSMGVCRRGRRPSG